MSSENPFAGPYGSSGPFGQEGTGDPGKARLCCPHCSAEDWDVSSRPQELVRICRKCGNKWSGGSLSAAQPEPGSLLLAPEIPAPEDEDIVINNYTGASFRDPSKNW